MKAAKSFSGRSSSLPNPYLVLVIAKGGNREEIGGAGGIVFIRQKMKYFPWNYVYLP